jgi:hypothetical protein
MSASHIITQQAEVDRVLGDAEMPNMQQYGELK